MPVKIKDTGAWNELVKGDVHLKHSGTVKAADQIWVKDAGTWHPMFPIVATARWGYDTYAGAGLNENGHTGPQDFIDGLTTMMPSNDDGEQFTYQQPDSSTYAYFAHPKILGVAVFTDVGTGFPGGWGGANYLQDSSNWDTASGPTEVTYDAGNGPEQWYVYRTDWAGPDIVPMTFSVTYPNRAD